MLITVGQHEAIICRFDADGSRCNFAEVKYVEKRKQEIQYATSHRFNDRFRM